MQQGTALTFCLQSWKLAQKLVVPIQGHHTTKVRLLSWVAIKLFLEVQRHIETGAQEFVDKKIFDIYNIYNFLVDHGNFLPTCKAALLLPDEIYRLEGSGLLIRNHLHNLNKRAHSFIEKQNAHQRRLAELNASAT